MDLPGDPGPDETSTSPRAVGGAAAAGSSPAPSGVGAGAPASTPGPAPHPRDPRRRAFAAAVTLTAMIVAGFVAFAVTRASRSIPSGSGAVILPPGSSLHPGTAVPVHFSLARLGGGKPVDLAALVGHRPTVVNFFASWCPDCVAELGALASVWRADRPSVDFVGLDTNDPNPTLARALLSRAGADYPVGIDSTVSRDSVGQAWGLANGLPVTFFLDRKGTIVLEVLGQESHATLSRRVAELAAGHRVR